MVQEAKASCRGKWYLPAGRMERNESIVVGEIGETTRVWSEIRGNVKVWSEIGGNRPTGNCMQPLFSFSCKEKRREREERKKMGDLLHFSRMLSRGK
jgi:hypothetical protein